MKYNLSSVKTNILYLFSSSELVILYIILMYVTTTQNLYGLYLASIVMFKIVVLYLTKDIFKGYSFGKRPSNAMNCNLFNCGGKSLSPGYPSGHMMNVGLFFMIIYPTINPENKNKFFILGLVVAITTGIGRYILDCHTLFQVISGLFYGLLVGYALNEIETRVLTMNESYRKDKEIFIKDINGLYK